MPTSVVGTYGQLPEPGPVEMADSLLLGRHAGGESVPDGMNAVDPLGRDAACPPRRRVSDAVTAGTVSFLVTLPSAPAVGAWALSLLG